MHAYVQGQRTPRYWKRLPRTHQRLRTNKSIEVNQLRRAHKARFDAWVVANDVSRSLQTDTENCAYTTLRFRAYLSPSHGHGRQTHFRHVFLPWPHTQARTRAHCVPSRALQSASTRASVNGQRLSILFWIKHRRFVVHHHLCSTCRCRTRPRT